MCMCCVYTQTAQAWSNKAQPGTVCHLYSPMPPELNSPPLAVSTSLCTTWAIRMKESLSKRLILKRLVNASWLKSHYATTPPSLNSSQWKWQPTGVPTIHVSLGKNGLRDMGQGWLSHETEKRKEAEVNHSQKAGMPAQSFPCIFILPL